MINITKVSILSGIKHTRAIDVTESQIKAWQDGALIQEVMPTLSVDDREFIMTGSTPEEWENLYGEEDEE